jgi:hypothetical protein
MLMSSTPLGRGGLLGPQAQSAAQRVSAATLAPDTGRGLPWALMIGTFLRRLIQRGARPMLERGATAPAFEAIDHNGATVRLADFAGKRVVLWFYPKADTPG